MVVTLSVLSDARTTRLFSSGGRHSHLHAASGLMPSKLMTISVVRLTQVSAHASDARTLRANRVCRMSRSETKSRLHSDLDALWCRTCDTTTWLIECITMGILVPYIALITWVAGRK